MLNEEELTPENLSNRVSNGLIAINNSIINLKKFMDKKNVVLKTDESKNSILYDLIIEWNEMLKIIDKEKPNDILTKKAHICWDKTILPKLQEYNNLIIQWNNCHKDKLKTIDERLLKTSGE